LLYLYQYRYPYLRMGAQAPLMHKCKPKGIQACTFTFRLAQKF
jgi:hypothetical protein